jgi:hypothetical protein
VTEIVVMQLGAEEFRVVVAGADGKRDFAVTVPHHARRGLGLHGVPPASVVEESFRFLLERKPAADISPAFVLSSIAGEFPEYPEEIRGRLG